MLCLHGKTGGTTLRTVEVACKTFLRVCIRILQGDFYVNQVLTEYGATKLVSLEIISHAFVGAVRVRPETVCSYELSVDPLGKPIFTGATRLEH